MLGPLFVSVGATVACHIASQNLQRERLAEKSPGVKLPAGAKIGPTLLHGTVQVVHVTREQAREVLDGLPPLHVSTCMRAGYAFEPRAFAMVDGVLFVPMDWSQDERICNRAHACLCRVNEVPGERRVGCSYRKKG